MRKTAVALSLFGILAVAAMRLLDFALFFDKESGFFIDGGAVSWGALIVGGAAVLYLAVLLFREKDFYGVVAPRRNLPLGITAFVSAATLIACDAVLFFHYREQDAMGIPEVSAIGFSMRTPFLVSTALFGIFLVAAGAVWCAGSNFFVRHSLWHLVSVLWALCLVLFVFIHYSVSVLLTENIFVILSAVLLAMAYMSMSKFVGRIESGGDELRSCLLLGSTASVITLGWALSSGIKYLFGMNAKGDVPLILVGILAVAGIYLLVFLGTVPFERSEPPEKDPSKGRRFRRRHRRR